MLQMLLPHLLQLLLYLHLLQKLLQLLLCHDKKCSLYSNVLGLQQWSFFLKKNFIYICQKCGQKFNVFLIDLMCNYLHLPHLLLQQLLSRQFLEQLQQFFLQQLQRQLQQLLQLLLPLQLQLQ